MVAVDEPALCDGAEEGGDVVEGEGEGTGYGWKAVVSGEGGYPQAWEEEAEGLHGRTGNIPPEGRMLEEFEVEARRGGSFSFWKWRLDKVRRRA